MDRIRECITLIREHKNIAKTAAAALVLIAAFVFFGGNGEKGDIQTESKETAQDIETDTQAKESSAEIYVDISGQVKSPGVYKVKDGSRLFEVIELAGGLTDEADVDGFNRAEAVTDGEKVLIPAKGQETASSSLININNSDSGGLEAIPGVGPATADKIVTYREEHGRFKNKEDIKNISGIGEKTYEKMESYITV